MELFYFILGILFVQYIIPLFDSFCFWAMAWVEVKKAGYSEIINDINLKIEKANTSAEKTNAIGFQLPEIYEEEDENYDED